MYSKQNILHFVELLYLKTKKLVKEIKFYSIDLIKQIKEFYKKEYKNIKEEKLKNEKESLIENLNNSLNGGVKKVSTVVKLQTCKKTDKFKKDINRFIKDSKELLVPICKIKPRKGFKIKTV